MDFSKSFDHFTFYGPCLLLSPPFPHYPFFHIDMQLQLGLRTELYHLWELSRTVSEKFPMFHSWMMQVLSVLLKLSNHLEIMVIHRSEFSRSEVSLRFGTSCKFRGDADTTWRSRGLYIIDQP